MAGTRQFHLDFGFIVMTNEAVDLDIRNLADICVLRTEYCLGVNKYQYGDGVRHRSSIRQV